MPSDFIAASVWTQEDEASVTNDTTIDDEYEMQRIDALTPQQRDLLEKHVTDQWEAVPSYFNRLRTDND